MKQFSLIQRMCLTALLLAVQIIATRFIGVYVTPYVRLSVGVAITIFSSILLGTISGAVIGGCGDILGIVLYNVSGVAINPFITITYALMGATPGLFMMLFHKIKINKKSSLIIFNILLILIWIGVLIFTLITNEITIFNNKFVLNTVAKALIPIISFIIMIAISLFTIFFNRHFKKKCETYNDLPSPYEIAFIVIFIQIVFTLLLNTWIKSAFYGVHFEVVFFPALLLSFIYIPGNTIIVSYLLLLANKTIKIHC